MTSKQKENLIVYIEPLQLSMHQHQHFYYLSFCLPTTTVTDFAFSAVFSIVHSSNALACHSSSVGQLHYYIIIELMPDAYIKILSHHLSLGVHITPTSLILVVVLLKTPKKCTQSSAWAVLQIERSKSDSAKIFIWWGLISKFALW